MQEHKILESLFESAVLQVCRCRTRNGRKVVVKRLKANAGLTAQKRFTNEFNILSRIDLPGVIKAFELKEVENCLVMVLEDIGGTPLSECLAQGETLTLEQFFNLAIGLAEILAGLQRLRIIHQDINPRHILINRNTEAFRLIGFGAASDSARISIPWQLPAAITGELAYLAPEQTGRINRQVDYRSDLYSLGATFYRLLLGKPPFQADDALGLVHQQITVSPQPPDEIDKKIPAALSAINMKLLSKEAEDRYQSAIGLKADLERCRYDIAAGMQPVFTPGQEDFSDQVQVPQKLYGRESELEQLRASYTRADSGGRELFLVAGYAGVGKTALVHESRRFIAHTNGCFIEGKFDRLQRSVPYFGWIQAFSGLVRYLLSESENRLALWRELISEALGNIGRVLTDLIPDLELVIGTQPEVPELAATETGNRFNLVFQQLIKAITTRMRPLVVFLDDLQWIDAASLNLLHTLLSSGTIANFLVISAYRDNEVDKLHPLMMTVEEMRKEKVAIESITVTELTEPTVNHLIADSLQSEQEQTAPLSRLVYSKTGGNPFFLLQTLKTLTENQVLFVNPTFRQWRWNIPAIEKLGITDNIVTLMLGKIRRLSPQTQKLLSLAASLGFQFHLTEMSIITCRTAEALLNDLQPALLDGLIERSGDHYQFVHDRVRDAAYANIEEEKRSAEHLQIARLLVQHLPQERILDDIFEIANHFNQGLRLIKQPAERERVAKLNSIAGNKAKTATAYDSAISYLAAGLELQGTKGWDSNYELTFSLCLDLAECRYLAGNFEQAEELLATAATHAASTLDQARIYRLRQRICQLSGRYQEAVTTSLQALALFGITFPEDDDEIKAATDREMHLIQVNLNDREVMELADVPFTDDAEVRTVLGLLAEAMPQIYILRWQLYPLIVARGVNLCLQKGHSQESPYIYGCYCMILVGLYNDIPAAFTFSQMALRLNEHLPSGSPMIGRPPFFHASVVNIWCRHFKTSLPVLDRAFQACLDSGDLIFAAYLTFHSIWLHLESGEPLEKVSEVAQRYIDFNLENHNETVAKVNLAERQFVLSLQGKTRSLADFNSASCDETACSGAIEEAGFDLGVAYYRIMKQCAAFLAGSFQEALAWADLASQVLPNVSSMAIWGSHFFYHGLTLTALYEQSPEKQQEFRAILHDIVGKLHSWTDNCPENYSNRYELIQAEIARIEGRDLEAMRCYEQALDSARTNGFIHHQALACELASRFYRAREFDRIADTYLNEALACYRQWGATAKVEQLKRLHPDLAPATQTQKSSLAEQLDALSIAKAQQAISGEIHPDRLARTLLSIVMENAGARTGFLSMEGGGRLRAEMKHCNDSGEHIAFETSPVADNIPEAVINYVRRSRETVILADAAVEAGKFPMDAYLQRHTPRSVLCMPIQRQEKLLAVVYLENNLVSGAFTPERRLVLEVLATQAAISLETAGIHETLQEREERFRLTMEAAHIGIFDWNVKEDTLQLSPEYFTMLGYSPESGKHERREWLNGLHPDDRPRVEGMIQNILSGTISEEQAPEYEYEARTRHIDGTYRWVYVKGFGVKRDQHGRITRMLGIRMDITERKLLEEKYRQAQKMEAIGQLAGGVAHDFNNMLGVVIGHTEMLLKDKTLADPVQRSLEQILAAAHHSADITRQMLAFARKQAIAPKSIDLNRAITGMLKLLRRLIGEDIDLTWSPAEKLWAVNMDPTQIDQILVNLCINARDAIAGVGKITIETRNVEFDNEYDSELKGFPAGAYVKLAVCDDGCGMDKETTEKIFEPFFTTKEMGKGTGLGLATVYGIVKQNDGFINVYSEPGHGTMFNIYLPRHRAAPYQEMKEENKLLNMTGTETILVVEDDALHLMMLKQALERTGYTVLAASTPKEALRLAEEHNTKIHLLLTDVIMPEMNGKDLAKAVADLDAEIPCLFMSGYTSDIIAHHGVLEEGAHFVQKPFSIRDLAVKIRELLDDLPG